MTDLASVLAERDGRDWALFVDRDGVINRRIPGDYVRSWAQFQLLPGAVEALTTLTAWAPHVVVVTNQQGIGKGLMSEQDVNAVHERLMRLVAEAGRPLDSVLVCPHLEQEGCACRKPGSALAEHWLRHHPDCAGALSVMVGDSSSDMAMANNLAVATGGCVSVKIGQPFAGADLGFDSMLDLAGAIERSRR